MSRAEVAARLRSGEWTRDLAGVLRAADHPVTPRSRIRAAMLSLGDGATLVGRSAAFWWHLTDVPPAEIEIAVAHGRRVRPRPGVRLLHRGVAPEERIVVDGVAVTRKPATVLAAVTTLGLLPGARFMDQALQAGVDLDALRREHLRTAGRHGATVASRLLALAGGGARSEAERTAHRALRGAGIVGWRANHEVSLRGYGQAFLDLAATEAKVLVEIDGWAYLRGLRAFLRDARRQNASSSRGGSSSARTGSSSPRHRRPSSRTSATPWPRGPERARSDPRERVARILGHVAHEVVIMTPREAGDRAPETRGGDA